MVVLTLCSKGIHYNIPHNTDVILINPSFLEDKHAKHYRVRVSILFFEKFQGAKTLGPNTILVGVLCKKKKKNW